MSERSRGMPGQQRLGRDYRDVRHGRKIGRVGGQQEANAVGLQSGKQMSVVDSLPLQLVANDKVQPPVQHTFRLGEDEEALPKCLDRGSGLKRAPSHSVHLGRARGGNPKLKQDLLGKQRALASVRQKFYAAFSLPVLRGCAVHKED